MSDDQSRNWKAICCCMLITILTGCAKAPEEVLDEINRTEDQKETVDEIEGADGGIVYTKVSELSESVPEYMTTTIGNLSFAGTITVPDTDCLYDLRLVPNTSFYENRETLIPDILAWYQISYDENFEIESWVDNESGTYMGLQDTESPEDYPLDFIRLIVSDLSIQINEDGVMVLWWLDRNYKGINHCIYHSVNVAGYETWPLWNRKVPDAEFMLDGENVSLQELYEDFSQVVELYNSQSDNLGLRIYSALYYQTEISGMAGVLLNALQTYQGVCFDPVQHLASNVVIDASGRSLLGGGLRGEYHIREDRCLFGLYNSSYIPVEELAVYDEVVSFESALELLSERLGEYYNADVEEAALFYLRYYYGEYGTSWNYWEEELITAYAHPYWRFVERWDTTGGSERTVYYVDAITGEVLCLYENCLIY